MGTMQADLCGPVPAAPEGPSDEVVAMVRARLNAALSLVRGAAAMPWGDLLSVIREDNAFRSGKALLPPEEGAALWAEFDAEIDPLYAVMNEGLELGLRF